MAEVKLKLKKELKFPLEADCITPDNFANKSQKEIKELPVYFGTSEAKLGDYFDVSGKAGELAELKIIIEGNLANVKRIGEKMSGGEIEIHSDVGMHVGNYMKGGKIIVQGNADDWAGAMLQGGELEIKGNAGHYVGAAYRGYWKGMTNGVIRVKGTIGNEAMSWARGAYKAKKFPTLYCGGANDFLGIHNHGGTMVVEGDVNRCAGADQARGTVVIKGKVQSRLPSFKKMGEVDEVELPNGEKIKGKFIEYSGDHSVTKESTGRLYIAA